MVVRGCLLLFGVGLGGFWWLVLFFGWVWLFVGVCFLVKIKVRDKTQVLLMNGNNKVFLNAANTNDH